MTDPNVLDAIFAREAMARFAVRRVAAALHAMLGDYSETVNDCAWLAADAKAIADRLEAGLDLPTAILDGLTDTGRFCPDETDPAPVVEQLRRALS